MDEDWLFCYVKSQIQQIYEIGENCNDEVLGFIEDEHSTTFH
jgi:hypothetical protein